MCLIIHYLYNLCNYNLFFETFYWSQIQNQNFIYFFYKTIFLFFGFNIRYVVFVLIFNDIQLELYIEILYYIKMPLV